MKINKKKAICFWIFFVLFFLITGDAVAFQAEGTETQITTLSSSQSDPDIYGDRIVWADLRNGNYDIYMYDLSTSRESRITASEANQNDPAIYGNRIVWTDDRNGDLDIYMFDLTTSTETQITTGESNQSGPAIYGNRIVWTDDRNGKSDIYMFDPSTSQETKISSSGSVNSAPGIYNDRIVWTEESDDFKVSLILYDLSTGKELQIAEDYSSFPNYPFYSFAIYGNTIVWNRVGDDFAFIDMYDLSTQQTTGGIGDGIAPDIYGDRIVWEEMLMEGDPFGEHYYYHNICMYNLSTQKANQTSNSGLAYDPAIYGDRIVWQDNRNGNTDIYMFSLASDEVPVLPVADFSCNTTSGYAPLSVLFTDLSQYATGRSWDFNNDGISDSSEKIPLYVFLDPGTYTVKLTVSNENGTASKADTITVLEKEENEKGENDDENGDREENTTENENINLPAADFSTNVTSGYYPLTVLFTDLSKNATGRSWDVNNDGVEDSNEASFVYTYSSRGTYEAKLTAINANGKDIKTATITVERKSSGGSSGGGGGGGGSPEPAKNVEVKELSQVFITNGKAVNFDFKRNATCVVYVGFDAKKNAGKTTTIVEQLKNKSALVPELPKGEVYKSFNVWVGNSGYASSENIENPVICFKVEKSWLRDKSIDQASIALNRYSDKKWEHLPANHSGEDNIYLYFTAAVPGFSSFAITGETKSTGEDDDIGTKLESESRMTNENESGNEGLESEQQTEQKDSTSIPGFGMVFSVAGLLTCILYKRK